jgi:hypothetical protein
MKVFELQKLLPAKSREGKLDRSWVAASLDDPDHPQFACFNGLGPLLMATEFLEAYGNARREGSLGAGKGQGEFWADDFLSKMELARLEWGLGTGQVAGILNTLRALKPDRKSPPPVDNPIANGTYTVVFSGEDDRITVTLKQAPWAKNKPAGTQGVRYKTGPDGESMFAGFFDGATYSPSKNYKATGGRVSDALEIIANGGDKEAGQRYALESGNCWHCHRELTVPASISMGLGPVCAEKLGL